MFESGMFPGMGNQLKTLREERGWTHEQAADCMNVSRSQFIKLERGERRLTDNYIHVAAKAFGVHPADVIAEPGESTIPVMGYVGAGSEIEPDFEQIPEDGLDHIPAPFHLPEEMIAFEVRGDSMMPMFEEGMILVVYREQRRSLESFFGERAVVRTTDGRRFVKTIMRGIDGSASLISWNAKPIENVGIAWVGEIFTIFPPSAIRRKPTHVPVQVMRKRRGIR